MFVPGHAKLGPLFFECEGGGTFAHHQLILGPGGMRQGVARLGHWGGGGGFGAATERVAAHERGSPNIEG